MKGERDLTSCSWSQWQVWVVIWISLLSSMDFFKKKTATLRSHLYLTAIIFSGKDLVGYPSIALKPSRIISAISQCAVWILVWLTQSLFRYLKKKPIETNNDNVMYQPRHLSLYTLSLEYKMVRMIPTSLIGINRHKARSCNSAVMSNSRSGA